MIARRSHTWRTAALIFALAQLGASTAMPVADALLDGEAASEAIHVEPLDFECARHHDALFCTVARSLVVQSTSPTAHGAVAVGAGLTVASALAHDLVETTGTRIRGSAGPRAPPLV